MIFGVHDLLTLAEAYCAATGETTWSLSRRAGGNRKLFRRLRDGHGCNLLTAEAVSEWFLRNWPSDTPWPLACPIIINHAPANSDPQAIRVPLGEVGIPRARDDKALEENESA